MKEAPPLTPVQKKALEGKGISESIRYLDTQGYSRADIARIVERRYQHVKNVLDRAERKKKTTVTLDSDLYKEMDLLAAEIGIRRDSFLGALLTDALSVLEELPPNSAETKDLLREFYRPDSSAQLEKGQLIRVNLNLPGELVTRINRACRERNVPRDLFFDAIIEVAVATLSHVESMMSDPINFYENLGNKFTASFHLSERDADQLRQVMENDTYMIQALANIKKVPIGSIMKSLKGLSPDGIRRLMANKDVQEEMDKLRSEDDANGDVSLDDLMDDVKWK